MGRLMIKRDYPSFVKDGAEVIVKRKININAYNHIKVGRTGTIERVGEYFRYRVMFRGNIGYSGDIDCCWNKGCGKCFWCCIEPIVKYVWEDL